MSSRDWSTARSFGRFMQALHLLQPATQSTLSTDDILFILDVNEIQADGQPKQVSISELGSSIPISAAGLDTQVQFNDGGARAGDSGLTFNKTTNALTAGSFIPTSSTIPSNGLYSPNTNQVALSTNGTERVEFGTSEVVFNDGGENYDFRVEGDTNSSLFFVDASADKVGIGTSLPNSLTEIRGTNAGAEVETLRLTNSSTITGTSSSIIFNLSTVSSTSAKIAAIRTNSPISSDTELAFSQSANGVLTERLRIDSQGRVGIGTTSPNYALDVSTTGSTISSSFTSDQSEQYIALKDSGTTLGHVRLGSTSGSMLFFAGNGDRGRFDSSGRLLVGTSLDSGGALLQVNGDRIRVATAKTPASASDTGTTGEICWDASYIYVCTATNTWKRAALSTW